MERHLTEGLLLTFQAELEREERSPATVEKYLRDVKTFFGFQGNQWVTKEGVIRFKKHLQDRYKPASVNSMLAAVNRFLKAQGWYDCLVRPLKIHWQTFRDSSRELTREEYFRLLKAAQDRGKTRLSLLMQTICAMGIRVSELPFITREALNTGRATVCLKGKTRVVLLPGALCRALKAWNWCWGKEKRIPHNVHYEVDRSWSSRRGQKTIENRQIGTTTRSIQQGVNRPGRCALVSGERCIFYKKEGK